MEHSCRTVAYLLPLTTSVRAFIFIVIPFIVIRVLVLISLFVIALFFPSTLLVVFAASVMDRTSLRV